MKDVPPRETSPEAKGKEKRLFSQANFQAKGTWFLWFLARLIPILIDQIAHGGTWSPTLNPALIECLLSMTTNTDDVTCTRDLVAYEKALRFEWRVKRAGKERA